MAASLVVAGFELLGATTNPEYRLAPGFDFGEGEPDQTTITSLYLDGEAVTGQRTRNRHMQLPLWVLTRNGSSLAANVNALVQAVDADTFTVQWTPDGGLPVIFDCYRATSRRPRDLRKDAQGLTALTLDFFAKPFGRTPTLSSISAAASDTQLDSFATAPTGATLDTSVKFEGTGSGRVSLTSVVGWFGVRGYLTSTPVARTYGTAKNLTGMNAVTLRMRWPVPGSSATITATLVLTSAAGNATIVATKKFNNGDTNWRLLSFPLTGNLGSLDITTVTGYSLTLASTGVPSSSTTSNLWVDDQRMSPPSAALTTTAGGGTVLLLPTVVGSARAPANLALASTGTFAQYLLHTPPVDQDIDAQILRALSTATNDQTVTIAADNAKFRGTYSLVLGGNVDGTAATVTVTVTQLENGAAVGSAWAQTFSWDLTTQGFVIPVGEITLPLYDTPTDNTLTTYTIRVNITAGTDRYSDVMLLDTRGQTVFTDGTPPANSAAVYVDEPGPLQSGSGVFTTSSDRTAAWSHLPYVVTSGGPILLEPGVNKVLAWILAGAPVVTASYYPRWLDERVS